jgi:Flp pilus assembly protein TadB
MLDYDMGSVEDDIAFVGLGLRPGEVVSGGRLVLLCSLLAVPVLAVLHPHPIYIVLALILPLLLQRTVLSYPATLAVRIEKASLREAPEMMSYLIGGAGGALTYENAVLSSAKNSRGMLKGGFQRMIWNVHTKGRSLPEDFAEYARKWKGRNDGFEEALRRYSDAVRLGRRDNLGSLMSPVHLHTRRKLKRYLASLKAPMNVVFALGIVLPVMIASLLPMSSLAVAAPAGIAGEGTSGGSALSPAAIAVILDIVFPLGMLLYCREVLSRRPFSSPGRLSLGLRGLCALLAAVSVTIVLGATAAWLLEPTPASSLLVLVFASSMIALAVLFLGRMMKGATPQVSREDVSEGLDSLGDSLLAGKPLEEALLKTAERMEGTELAGRITRDIFLMDKGTTRAGETLTCESAIREEPIPGSNLKAVVDITQKDGILAGTVAKLIASDLRDMSRIEADARDEMSAIVQTVNSTLTFFSPLVLGVTASMSMLMETHFSDFGGMTPSALVLILGALLCCNLAVAGYFTQGLQGGDVTAALSRIGKGLIVSIPLYSLSFLCASYFFGVL